MATAKTPPSPDDTRPALPWAAIIQTALKAQELAQDNQAGLGKRIKPAFLAAFEADILALDVAVPAVQTVRDGSVQLTATQLTALTAGCHVIKGIREAVKGQNPKDDVRLAYTVGVRVQRRVVKSVRSALDTIGKRIAAQPTEAESFGITDEDAKAVTDAIAAIDKASQAQDAALAAVPATTRERNQIARRLLKGIKLISGAGMRAFATDSTLYPRFAALTEKGA